MKRALIIILLSFSACTPGAEKAELGYVHVGLDISRCSDFCIDTVQATLFRPSDPYTPAASPVITSCAGAEVINFEFNAGTTLFAEVQMSSQGQLVLDGESSEATIAIDQDTMLDVVLSASEGSGPYIQSVEPNPVVEGAQLTLYSSELPAQEGWWDVLLNEESLNQNEVEWNEESNSVAVTLEPGVGGTSLMLRNCGLTSNAVPIRIMKLSLELSGYELSACNRLLSVESYTEGEGDKALVLCADSQQGNLTLFDFEACQVGQTVLSFSAPEISSPLSHVALQGSEGWVWVLAQDGSVQKNDLSSGQVVFTDTLSLEEPAADFVCTETYCYVLTSGIDGGNQASIVTIVSDSAGEEIEDLTDVSFEAEEIPQAMLMSEQLLYVVTRDDSADISRLKSFGGVSTTEVILPESCSLPLAIAHAPSNNMVVVTCVSDASFSLVAVDLSGPDALVSSSSIEPGHGDPTSLAFDVDGDLLFIVTKDTESTQKVLGWKVVAANPEPVLEMVHYWDLPAGLQFDHLTRATASNRFVGIDQGNTLNMFHPYLGQAECVSEAESP